MTAPQITAQGAQAPGEIVWNFDGQIHPLLLLKSLLAI
jgi:hypothetical protein